MEQMQEKISFKNIYYPPGGIMLWIIIFLELGTFGLGLLGLAYYGALTPELFHEARMHLNTLLGTSNTLILLVSGYTMARAVAAFRSGDKQKAKWLIKITLIGGALFLALKSYEYYEKLASGLEMWDNMFYTFYWLLTGFHLVHVVVGMVILGYMSFKIDARKSPTDELDLESGAAFWHMCDLIWLLLFPSLYLIF
ncbi:cytochrome c oxidase subunit 3 [Cyclobacterium amurskyense]|uniref:Putative nitric oxide reductase (Nor) complex membrane protein n=2 Tax=Cyclobacterium amurskyense TaxID=320787 RepID=A0A0H4PN27_9BACT|nr:cytochrome c oxidase subunit 3 [Cyclobacterium amurskyense]AKP49667.1 Putative nitric oxide reductase (Nor) complex membrane protein [Cyclobacterium amurskyense]|tara:strand:+ start:496 stop:1083 length:588 start_codon:yes stop_codon:yes gene_type:complete